MRQSICYSSKVPPTLWWWSRRAETNDAGVISWFLSAELYAEYFWKRQMLAILRQCARLGFYRPHGWIGVNETTSALLTASCERQNIMTQRKLINIIEAHYINCMCLPVLTATPLNVPLFYPSRRRKVFSSMPALFELKKSTNGNFLQSSHRLSHQWFCCILVRTRASTCNGLSTLTAQEPRVLHSLKEMGHLQQNFLSKFLPYQVPLSWWEDNLEREEVSQLSCR